MSRRPYEFPARCEAKNLPPRPTPAPRRLSGQGLSAHPVPAMRRPTPALLSLAILACCLTGCASVGRRLILPGSYPSASVCTVPAADDYELVPLTTTDGTRLIAQFTPAPASSAPPRPTVLFFYGNRMSIAASQPIVQTLHRLGLNVLVPDYPGYGMSAGPRSEQGCYAAADAALGHLRQRPGVDPHRIVIVGLSLGGGVAVDLATRERVAGLVLVVPFTRIRDVGQDMLPAGLRWLAPSLSSSAAFDNLAKISRVACPVLLVEATHDQLTPAARTAQLARAVTAPLTRHQVDADHDGAWRQAEGEIARWLSALAP